jgi:hypothetical protein
LAIRVPSTSRNASVNGWVFGFLWKRGPRRRAQVFRYQALKAAKIGPAS